MPMISAQEAAKRLNVNVQRVRALAGQGKLRGQKIANRWLFDEELLGDEEKRRRARGRPYAPLHALGILFLASHESAPWLSRYEVWRAQRYALPRLKQLGGRLRARARIRFYRAAEPIVHRLRRDGRLVLSGVSAAESYDADIAAPKVLDAYCLDPYAESLIHRYALRDAGEASANVILRLVEDPRPLSGRRVMPRAVVAYDLADSGHERTRRAGAKMLEGIR